MNIISKNLKKNATPKEYSMTGVEIKNERIFMLCGDISVNTSLQILHMSRKKLNDESGVEIAKMLMTNTTLIKLELEGNNLMSETASEFAKSLRVNKTL